MDLGVCSQGESDSGSFLPTQECTAGLVTSGACLSGWELEPKVTIPRANKCSEVARWYIRDTNKSHGNNGIKKLEDQRKIAPGDTSGGWG